MLTAGTVLYIAATYVIMFIAYRLPHWPWLHRPVMSIIICLDLLFPFYLYATKDWGRRLIDEGEMFSFMIWLHLILLMTLYMLYFVQVRSARALLRGEEGARSEHKSQGLGIMIIRGLVLVSGAMLVEPNGPG
jgi:hypothetical protein